jgi:antitoxin VapB
MVMSKTRIFKSGNSQAVRIPADMAYADMDVDYEIQRMGDMLTITPIKPNIEDAIERLRKLARPDDVWERESIEMPERDWS